MKKRMPSWGSNLCVYLFQLSPLLGISLVCCLIPTRKDWEKPLSLFQMWHWDYYQLNVKLFIKQTYFNCHIHYGIKIFILIIFNIWGGVYERVYIHHPHIQYIHSHVMQIKMSCNFYFIWSMFLMYFLSKSKCFGLETLWFWSIYGKISMPQ